ncbi:transcriptional regulator [Alphaproteobacteria bacterium 46_93_T64]|nr:transcriptional regulator [Alphaproteobacteria bacterium 46_93_T64]
MTSNPLSLIFAALADETRRQILEQLATGEKSAGELAKPFAISAPAISRHLKVLENAGLIERKIDAQWRRCSLNAGGFKQASDWVSQYRKFWEDRFAALDTYLDEVTKEKEPSE